MRIPAPQARALFRGTKTIHRVPVDARLTAQPLRPARRHDGKPFRPQIDDILTFYGGDYTTDGERRRWITTHVAHARVLSAERTELGRLSDEQAREEGHETAAEFEIAWVEQHQRDWIERQAGYLLEQGMPETEVAESRDAWAIIRYEQYWSTREAWVLTLESFGDVPYLLPGLPDEPEAIPLDRLHMRWSVKAARRYQAAVGEELRVREAKQLGRRLKSAMLRDPTAPEIVEIQQQLRALETRFSQAA